MGDCRFRSTWTCDFREDFENRGPTANHCYIFIGKIYGTICSFNKKKKS